MVLRKAAAGTAAGKAALAKVKGGAGQQGGLAKKTALATGPFVDNSFPAVGPAGLIVQVNAPATATLSLSTAQGNATIALAELATGGARSVLGGRIEVRRVPVHAMLTTTAGQEDFPAAVSDGRDGAGSPTSSTRRGAPSSHRWSRRSPRTSRASSRATAATRSNCSTSMATTPSVPSMSHPPAAMSGGPPWRSRVATRVVVVWSENRDGNWELFARHLNTADGSWAGPAEQLTQPPGADTDAVLATDATAASGWHGRRRLQRAGGDQPRPGRRPGFEINVSNHPADDWSPALAIGPEGRPYVAFDSYRNGSFDVFLYRGGDGNAPGG